MADKSIKTKGSQVKRKVSYAYLHRLAAAVSLLAFFVIALAGVMAQARVVTIAYRSALVMVVIVIVSRVVVRVLATYEEMNSGKG